MEVQVAQPSMTSTIAVIVSRAEVLVFVVEDHFLDSSTTQDHTHGLGLVLVVAVDLMSPVVLMKIDVETL